VSHLAYKIKNKLFLMSNENLKTLRPSYNELIKYENVQKKKNNKFVISFAAGRSGQNWLAKLFNSHPNWVGACERFADYESFYRYISYYNLPIDKEALFKLFELASKRDMAKYQNTFISSPYFSFGVEELTRRLNPDYLFFQIREPIATIESMYRKGWYNNSYYFNTSSPLIEIEHGLGATFSRIIPHDEYLDDWIKLTRIGKITWFWSTINKAIYDDFKKIKNIEKVTIRLEDINQNFNIYEHLSDKFDFENKMTEKQFHSVINKAPNRGPSDKYKYKDWNISEKTEFEDIVQKVFPLYNNMKTEI
jgi:hypothetical protein